MAAVPGGTAPDLFPNHLAPLIPPDAITTILRHSSDPNRRRATYRVPYPVYEIALEKKADLTEKLPPRFENGRRTVNGIRFFVVITDLLIPDTDFTQCKFHRFDDGGNSRVTGTTFINCTFDKCFLGGTLHRHVRFDRCTFRRCDFGMSQFIDCQFHSCTFADCTGEHVSFVATEINPSALLAGMPCPHYNYDSAFAGELSPQELSSQWLEIRRALAAQLVKSNGEIHHTAYCDAGVFELKSAELKVRVDLLTSRRSHQGILSQFREALRCGTFWLTLGVTKGGTSIARLVYIAFCAVPAYAVLLSLSSVTFQGHSCHVTVIALGVLIEQLSRAASLFLAFGYTAFIGQNAYETALLTIGAAVGLIWYALLAAVVIRRVYK